MKTNTTKYTAAETPETACRIARSHIASLMNALQDELADTEMTEDTWPVAGSLSHVRELLAETVGFLKGVEGSEIVTAMINKSR